MRFLIALRFSNNFWKNFAARDAFPSFGFQFVSDILLKPFCPLVVITGDSRVFVSGLCVVTVSCLFRACVLSWVEILRSF